jgi:hypothetical protein
MLPSPAERHTPKNIVYAGKISSLFVRAVVKSFVLKVKKLVIFNIQMREKWKHFHKESKLNTENFLDIF